MSKSTAPLTTAGIREFLRANPDLLATFSPEAQATVVEGARGRLHVDVRKGAPKMMGRRYVEGTAKSIPVTYRNAKGRKVTKYLPEAEARALAGDAAGKRGPLSAKALVAAGEAYAASLV